MKTSAVLYYPYLNSIRKFDPHVINNASEACLSQNLYSRLVDLEDDGNISGDLADDIEWDGRSYKLHIRTGLKTRDGYSVGASDVVTSLNRNFVLDQNTHGSLRTLINESGIRQDGEFVYLTPKNPRLKTFLMTLLASYDFSIIPAVSLDLTKPDMPIKDWRNTSGAYYVEQDDESGAFTLKINTTHHSYNGRQIESFKLHPGYGYDAVELFNKGEVDIIPTITVADTADFLNVDSSSANVHKTENIYLNEVIFTASGLKKFSVNERIAIGQRIKTALLQVEKKGAAIPMEEHFPLFSEGALESTQVAALNQQIARAKAEPIHAPARFAVWPSKLEYFKKALQSEPMIAIEPSKGPSWLRPEDQQPDLYYVVVDSSFLESLSLLHYNFEMGTLLSRSDGMKWLEKYMWTEDKKVRIAMLKELHFQALMAGRITPISVSPYFAVARKPLKIGFSKFYAGSPLWKLTID